MITTVTTMRDIPTRLTTVGPTTYVEQEPVVLRVKTLARRSGRSTPSLLEFLNRVGIEARGPGTLVSIEPLMYATLMEH